MDTLHGTLDVDIPYAGISIYCQGCENWLDLKEYTVDAAKTQLTDHVIDFHDGDI